MTSILKIAAVAVSLLSAGATAASANCQSEKTTGTALGVVGGGVVGNVITHGSVVGTLAGAAGGGFLGHRLSGNDCRRVAYYRHRHYYTDREGRRHYYYTASR